MINTYLALKVVHIISSVLLVGTGLGSAFYLFFIHRTRNQAAITEVIKLVVKADYWFTLPTIVLQPITGFAMLHLAHLSPNQPWVIAALALYVVAGICYVPVFFLQLKMQYLAKIAQQQQQPLPQNYWRCARIWEYLGYPAFIAMSLIFWLMVAKPT